jgi:hypothetical protein
MKTHIPSLKFLLLLLIPICLIWYRPAHACGGCGENGRASIYSAINPGIISEIGSGCEAFYISMPMLSPGNDMRVNLMLLMSDLHGVPSAAKASSDNPPQFDFGGLWVTLFPSHPDSNRYSEYNYCTLQSESAKDAFNAGIKGETGLSASERDFLIQLRQQITGCSTAYLESGQMDSDPFAEANSQIRSKIGTAYLRYLMAAAAFHRGDYEQATSDFAALTKADSAWVRETATYLLARTAVRVVQNSSFNEYGNLKQANPADAAAANKALDAYISAYPKGLYANSARGLKRRVSWLSGDINRLAVEYANAIVQDRTMRNVDDGELVREMDNTLLFRLVAAFSERNASVATPHVEVTDPILLAVIDLYRMRQVPPDVDAENHPPSITRETLLAQRPHFAKQKALFDFLLVAHTFYVERKSANVLALIPGDTGQTSFSYLQFSNQMLRGLAMQGKQDEQAREHYVNMLARANLPSQRSALELAIALIDQNSGQVARIFAADSPVRNQDLRGIALSYFADASLLRKQAQDASVSAIERETAIFVLLYKELTRGFYADFLRDMALIPTDIDRTPTESPFYRFSPTILFPIYYYYGYGTPLRPPLGLFLAPKEERSSYEENSYDCPTLKDIAATLAKNANDTRAKLCIAEFIRRNNGDGFVLDTAAKNGRSDSLSLFPGEPYSRQAVYRSVIADPNAPPEDKAYALYRAVYCYARSGYNSCGGEYVELAERKAWFTQLKKQYPKSVWAKRLKYYW